MLLASFVDLAACYALLQYLTGTVDGACDVLEQAIHIVDARSSQREDIYEFYVKLLHRHAESNVRFPIISSTSFLPSLPLWLILLLQSVPPSLLRSVLLSALREYPTNAYFLSLFIEGEARSQISGRVRAYFDDAVEKYVVLFGRICAILLILCVFSSVSPVIWLFAIHTETARLGATHRVRTLFERALENPQYELVAQILCLVLTHSLQESSVYCSMAVLYRLRDEQRY